MTIEAILTGIRDHLEVYLPGILAGEELPNIAVYEVGYPSNQEDTFCCVRLASIKGKETLEFQIHLALPGKTEVEGYKYLQAVQDYLEDVFDQSEWGYSLGEYSLDLLETSFTHGDIQALFSVTLTEPQTDCD